MPTPILRSGQSLVVFTDVPQDDQITMYLEGHPDRAANSGFPDAFRTLDSLDPQTGVAWVLSEQANGLASLLAV